MNPLGAARHARGLSLADIARATRLSPRHIKAMDEGRFDDLPPGIYARAYVRAFAAAVGLGPSEVEPVFSLLPQPADPFPTLRAVQERSTAPSVWPVALRVCAAATLDALLLLALTVAIVATVATTCGLTSGELLERAPLPLAVLAATTWLEYFLLLAGIHGRTAGERLCGLADRRADAPLNLTAILQRAASPSERLAS